jgi:hypothetical protein
MSEHDNDGFYWEPSPADDLRQGDLLINVPTALMPDEPRFVLGPSEEVATVTYPDYPESVPSSEIVVDARFGQLSMVITPTCHVSADEKDEDIVAVVPVEPLNLLVPDLDQARAIAGNKNVPKHFFILPPTELSGGLLQYYGAALLDRPASMLKHNLRDYRRLGLFVDARIELRKALARFWARGDASESIERAMRPQIERRKLEDLE